MKHSYKLSGATCESCKQKIIDSLEGISEIEKIEIDDSLQNIIVFMTEHIALNDMQLKLAKDHGSKYKLNQVGNPMKVIEKHSFKPLVLVVAYVLLGSFIGMYLGGNWSFEFGMRMFMGLFFLSFSFFKFLDVKGFAYSYISYDILASKWIGWGFIYPFLEFGLGILYMIGAFHVFTNVFTAILMFFGLIGVLKAVLKKSKIKCVCLGTGFNLPMTYVTVVENGSMFLMALYMITTN